MRIPKIGFLVFFVLLAFTSCKKGKGKVGGSDSSGVAKPARPLPTATEWAEWPQPFWTAKAKVSVQHPGMNVSFQMSIRCEKGQCIWFSAQALGLFEVARGKVTADSIFVLDKINNRVLVGGLDGLQSYVPVPMGIAGLQHFLMGRVFWDSLFIEGKKESGDSTFISGSQGDISYSGNIWNRYFLVGANARMDENQSQVSVRNLNFKSVGNSWIAYRKELNSSQFIKGKKEESGLNIDFSRFEFVGQRPEMDLEIPKDWERQVIR